jgi:hypothetical protein
VQKLIGLRDESITQAGRFEVMCSIEHFVHVKDLRPYFAASTREEVQSLLDDIHCCKGKEDFMYALLVRLQDILPASETKDDTAHATPEMGGSTEFQGFYDNEHLSDLTILVGPHENPFHTHKIVLAARCPKFERLHPQGFEEGVVSTQLFTSTDGVVSLAVKYVSCTYLHGTFQIALLMLTFTSSSNSSTDLTGR